MKLADAQYHIVCARDCGFKVPGNYFELKQRFDPGLCPRCGGRMDVVSPKTGRGLKAYLDARGVIRGGEQIEDDSSS